MNLLQLFISFSLHLFLFAVFSLLLLLLQACFLNPFELGLIIMNHLEKVRKNFLNLNFHLIEVIISWLYSKCLKFHQFRQLLYQIVSFDQMIIQDLLHFDRFMACLFSQIFLHQSQLKVPILHQLYFFFLRPHDLRLIKLKKGPQQLQVILHKFFQQQQAHFLFLILYLFLVYYQYQLFYQKFQSY